MMLGTIRAAAGPPNHRIQDLTAPSARGLIALLLAITMVIVSMTTGVGVARAEIVPPAPVSATLAGLDRARGTNQLVAYTSARGTERTGTNNFGYEVVVVDGRIVIAGGNNNVIPAGSSIAARTFVLSGHGTADKWLALHASIGAEVTVSGLEVTITVDGRSYILMAEQAVREAEESVRGAEQACVDFDRAKVTALLDEAAGLIDEANAAGTLVATGTLATEAAGLALDAKLSTVESRTVEGRAIWVRPTETTPEAIAQTLDSIAATGFNMVFLETIFQGYTIYPSAVAESHGIESQRPAMIGFDPLAVWITEAHARGIELHPWVHTFYVGADQTGDGIGPVLRAHPEWAAVEREDVGATTPMPSSKEVGYYFVDPAHPEVQEYVLGLYEEILTSYEVDGIHLDYIRYPVSQPAMTAGYSYSDYTRGAFEAEHGVDPYDLDEAAPLWNTWVQWRIDTITDFVGTLRAMQQDVAPDVLVSAAVFADPVDGLSKKFQDWGAWVDNGLVDILTGMAFGASGAAVGADTAVMRARVGDNLLYTATYGAYHGRSPAVVVEQVAALPVNGSDGAGVFSYTQLTPEQARALALGPFRLPAITPHADVTAALTAGIADLRDTATTCSTPGLASLVPDLDAASVGVAAGDANAVRTALSQGQEKLLAADDPASRRAARNLTTLERWVDRAGTIDPPPVPPVVPIPVPEDALTEAARGGVNVPRGPYRAGDAITATLPQDQVGKEVTVWVRSEPVLLGEPVWVPAGGQVVRTLPAGLASGLHRLVFQGVDNTLIGWAEIEVVDAVDPVDPTPVPTSTGGSGAGTESADKTEEGSAGTGTGVGRSSDLAQSGVRGLLPILLIVMLAFGLGAMAIVLVRRRSIT